MKYFVDSEAKRIDLLDERWYKVMSNGKEHNLRSVTTFLESFPKGYPFRQWLKTAGFNADIIMKQAGEFGSKVHNLIEQSLKGETVQYNELDGIEVWERFLTWLDWWKELNENHEVKWSKDFVELITYDLEYQYAGTVDFVVKIDNEYVVVDWKTGNYIGDEAHIQLSAYTKSVERQFKIEIYKALIVWIPAKRPNKKGYRVIDVENINDNFEDFLHTQALYFRTHKNEKPKYKTLPTTINLKELENEN